MQLLKQKASLLKIYRLSRTPESKINFIQIRNKCTAELRKAKTNYFKQQITLSAANPKMLWQTLKVITGENVNKKNVNIQISLQGILISDSDKIARAFNDYFVSSVKELATNFEIPCFSPVLSLTSDQFSFSEISQNEVKKFVALIK